MNSAGDHPLGNPRRQASDWHLYFLDAGYILLSAGCTLLLSSAFPGAPIILPAAFLILSGLLLFPVWNHLRRRLQPPSEGGPGLPHETGQPEILESNSARAPSRHPLDERTSREEAAVPADPRDLLLNLSRILLSTSDFDVLLELISSQTLRHIPAVSIRMALVDGDAASLAYAFYSENGIRRLDREGIPFPAEEDLAGEVLRTGRALLTGDYSEACRARNLPGREAEPAWAGFPLPAGASVIGVMVLLRDTAFSENEQSLLEAIAATAGPAIANTRLERESSRRAALLAGLVRASRRIIGAGEDSLPDAILSGARDLLPCQSAFLLLPNSAGSWSVERRSGGSETAAALPPIGLDHPFTKSITDDRPVLVNRLPADDPFLAAARDGGSEFHSAVSLILRRKERIQGWLVFWNPVRASPPSEGEGLLLNEFAAVCTSALDKSRPGASVDLASAALSEELTSLQHLDQELNSAKDSPGALAVTLDWAIRHADAAAGLAAVCHEDSFEVAAVSGYPQGSGPEPGTRLPPESAGFSDSIRSGKAHLRRGKGPIVSGVLSSARSSLFLPIRHNTQNLGVLLLESDSETGFPPAQVEFLERLASHAAVAISNAQLYAEVRSANQAKSEFISFVAHELKTPMTSIRGYADLVAQGAVGPVNQPQANFLATIRLNVDRMAALVSDLNDVSRIESGRLKLEFTAVALAPALDEVVEALRSQIEGKEQKLTLEIPGDLPPAWVDRGRLIQILTNLVSNAYKYTPHGGSLRIAAERSPNRWDPAGPPEVVHFLIQDSGLGISLQEQKSIFQKFFRSEDGTVRDLPGTGLGLHITRNLVEMHGGKIWFESELHKGSTFHFTVPAASV